jgi:hypothetical protein
MTATTHTIAAVNQDHKKNNHAQKTQEVSWENPSQSREKPNNPLLYCQEKIHHPPPNLAHNRVLL